MKDKKLMAIIAGIVVGVLLFFGMWFISVNNTTITLEEQIMESNSAVEVQEKRRIDLIGNLVDCVTDYAEYEAETMQSVIAARQSAESGNIEEAKMAINAVAEQYPNLKAQANYASLMNELSTTENLIAEYRNNYNQQIKAYNKYTRKFPNSLILGVMGYEKVNFEYAEFGASSDAPTDLFAE